MDPQPATPPERWRKTKVKTGEPQIRRQNAQEYTKLHIKFHKFSGVMPRTPVWTPREGKGEGRDMKGKGGRRGRGRKGKGDERCMGRYRLAYARNEVCCSIMVRSLSLIDSTAKFVRSPFLTRTAAAITFTHRLFERWMDSAGFVKTYDMGVSTINTGRCWQLWPPFYSLAMIAKHWQT